MSEKRSSAVKQKQQQTPTPLRKMEDPTLWHVMPSRSSRKSSNDRMKPPPPKKKKIVLAEEEYLDALGKVIERDYYPDLDKYRTYSEVCAFLWPFSIVPKSEGDGRLRPCRKTLVPSPNYSKCRNSRENAHGYASSQGNDSKSGKRCIPE